MRTLAIFACFTLPLSVLSTPEATAQTVVSSGYVCPQCGRVHANQSLSPQPVVNHYPGLVAQTSYSQPTYAQPSSHAQPSSYAQRSYGGGGASNVLSMLNSQRARQGIGSLSYDPTLQAVAQRRAQQMASMGLKNHPPGSFSPGRYEGVGWSSSFSPSGVSACYTSDPSMRAAGAAMATGSDGVYFVVVYR